MLAFGKNLQKLVWRTAARKMFDFTNYPLNEYIQLCQQDHKDMIMNTQGGVGISKNFLVLRTLFFYKYLCHNLA